MSSSTSPLCDPRKRAELLAAFEEIVCKVKHSSTFKKLTRNFKNHESQSTYNCLINYLRSVNDNAKRKLKINVIMGYTNDHNVPVWNSLLSDNTLTGNSFDNFINDKIVLNNIIEYQIAIKANAGHKQKVDTEVAVYYADKTGSVLLIGFAITFPTVI
jgi:hypothetical protein